MALYGDKIAMGCVKKEGKLVCYAYDLSSLPPGASDPSFAKNKCEIIFDSGEPQFKFTGRDGYRLCEALLSDMKRLTRNMKDIEIAPGVVSKAMEKLESEAGELEQGEQ